MKTFRIELKTILTGFAVLTVAATLSAFSAEAQAPKRAITKIAGDLYRFQNNFHFSVFLVTPAGVIVTDPINAEAATWLRDEIKKRFNKPILVYSHDHPDHISGGEIFKAEGAIVVAHENAKSVISGEKRPTALPDLTFRDNMNIELGGKTVELSYLGPSHSDNLIVMRFPDARALFTVDFISVNRTPFKTLGDSYFPGWIKAIKAVEGMDFDILVPGHGAMGTKSDAIAHRQYLEDLYKGVLSGLREGKSAEELKSSVGLDKYSSWGQFKAWRPLNIEGMARIISANRRGN